MNIVIIFILFLTQGALLNEMFGNRNAPIELRGTLDRGGGTLDGLGAFRSHTYYFSTIEHPEIYFTIIENYTAELDQQAYAEAMRYKQHVFFSVRPHKPVGNNKAGEIELSNNSYLVLGMKTSSGKVIMDLQETQKVLYWAWWRNLSIGILLAPFCIMIPLKLLQKEYRTKTLGQILASFIPKRQKK